MANRFTDSRKWDDPWFRELPCKYKAFWFFLLDKCDHAGVWKVDFKGASFHIGEEITPEEALKIMNGRIIDKGDKWFIPKFIDFQYRNLSEDNRVHRSIIEKLKKEGVYKGLKHPLQGAKDKDKEQDKDKVKDNVGGVGDKYLTLWNSKMPWRINDITDGRHKHLNERLKEPSFVDNFPAILDKILASDFLTGRKPSDTHPNFKADFDWLISNDTNHVKVMEGKYDNKAAKTHRKDLVFSFNKGCQLCGGTGKVKDGTHGDEKCICGRWS